MLSKKTFSEPVRRGWVTALVGCSEHYTVDATKKELTLELEPKDVIAISTYVEQRPYMGGWTLQSVAKKFRVTQEMDKSIIVLNKKDRGASLWLPPYVISGIECD